MTKFLSAKIGGDQLGRVNFDTGDMDSGELCFTVIGAMDLTDATLYAMSRIGVIGEGGIPAVFFGAPCLGINRVDPYESDTAAPIYDVYMNYQLPKTGGSAIVTNTYTFNTVGGNARIFNSKETRSTTAVGGGAATIHYGAINVTSAGVEGADIEVSRYDFAIDRVYAAGELTDELIATIRSLSDHTNSEVIFGAEVQEIIFHGATGQRLPDLSGGVSFQFSWQKQLEAGFTVGPITVPHIKCGWDLLWVEYEDYGDTGSKRRGKKPVGVYIERVYDTADLTELGFT